MKYVTVLLSIAAFCFCVGLIAGGFSQTSLQQAGISSGGPSLQLDVVNKTTNQSATVKAFYNNGYEAYLGTVAAGKTQNFYAIPTNELKYVLISAGQSATTTTNKPGHLMATISSLIFGGKTIISITPIM